MKPPEWASDTWENAKLACARLGVECLADTTWHEYQQRWIVRSRARYGGVDAVVEATCCSENSVGVWVYFASAMNWGSPSMPSTGSFLSFMDKAVIGSGKSSFFTVNGQRYELRAAITGRVHWW